MIKLFKIMIKLVLGLVIFDLVCAIALLFYVNIKVINPSLKASHIKYSQFIFSSSSISKDKYEEFEKYAAQYCQKEGKGLGDIIGTGIVKMFEPSADINKIRKSVDTQTNLPDIDEVTKQNAERSKKALEEGLDIINNSSKSQK